MKFFIYVLSGLLIVLSFLISLISPLFGLILLLFSIIMIYINNKKSSRKTNETSLNSRIDLSSDNIPTSTTRIRFNVMGLKYEGRNGVLHSYVSSRVDTNENGHRVLKEDDIIELRDEDNPHDPNAMAIYHSKLGKIGYVPKDTTKRVRTFFKTNTDYAINIRFSEQDEEEYVATVRIITPIKG